MKISKKNLFTISQFAKLHHINKKTLMWYDEVDLFKPAVIKENGYRYYTYQQSSALTTILTLRELDMPIPEIKEFMKQRSGLMLEKILKDKLEELDQTILRLQSVRSGLSKLQNDMLFLETFDLSEIHIIELENRNLLEIPMSPDMSYESDFENVMTELQKHTFTGEWDMYYGAMISVENLYNGDFQNYTSYFIEAPDNSHPNSLHIQPKGKYLRAYWKGSWDNLYVRYQELIEYAKQHHIEFTGYAYERGINEILVGDMSGDDYITQIDIPIKC